MKKPQKKSDWKGRYVRLKRQIETNGGDVYKAGEIMQVAWYGTSGLHLWSFHRVGPGITRYDNLVHEVSEDDAELLIFPEGQQPVVDALRADVERLKGDLEWREEELTKAEDEIAAFEHEVEDLRAEVERLRQSCAQVREWGIELASLQPEEREQRFYQLWPKINGTLRAARKADQ